MTQERLWLWVQGPVRSYVVSQAYSVWSIIVFSVGLGYARGEITGFPTLAAYFADQTFWFALLMALMFGVGPLARARQGYKASVVPVANPTSVSLPTSLPLPPSTGGERSSP